MWCNNPFFLYIVITMNSCNDSTNKFLYRLIYTYNVCILFFSIWRKYPLNISIIDWIIHILVLRMITSKWSINHYFYNIANHYNYLRKFRFVEILIPCCETAANKGSW